MSLKALNILCFGAFVCFRREAVSVTTVYAVKSSTASARKVSVNSDTSETLKNGCHVGFEPETSDGQSGKKSRFFQKSGANLHPCLAVTPIERYRCENGNLNIRSRRMAGRRGNVRIGHFHLFPRKMEKSLSVCEKITNIRLGKFFEKSRNVSRFFAYVPGGRNEE